MDDNLNKADFHRAGAPPVPKGAGGIVPQQPQVAAPGATPAGGQPGQESGNRLAKLLAGCGVFFLVLNVIGAFALVLTLGSCMRSCSDDPIRDTPATAAFISDPVTTERDLEIFDALRGKFESRYEIFSNPDSYSHDPSVDVLRDQVASGRWPADGAGYGGPDSSLGPQLWVRLAELSEDYLEGETGEDWQVVDFEYPFPNNGPIPVPPKRDAGDDVVTVLTCTSGPDEGITAWVSYWRWAKPASFTTNLDEVREETARYEKKAAELEASGVMEGRAFVRDNVGDIYVWARDAEDPLMDEANFLEFANACLPHLNDYDDVVLLAPDTPAMLSFDYIGDYPNRKPVEEVTPAEAQRRLQRSWLIYDFENAYADGLLVAKVRDGAIDPSETEGPLSSSEPYSGVMWNGAPEGGSFDEGLAAIAGELTQASPEQIVALSAIGTTDDGALLEKALLVLPGGTVPETPAEFIALLEELRARAAETLGAQAEDGTECRLRLEVFIVDEQQAGSVAGEARSFADLRAAALEDPASLADWEVDPLLVADPYTAFSSDTDPYLSGTDKGGIFGSLSRKREWVFADNG